jgi:hypothetical protein
MSESEDSRQLKVEQLTDEMQMLVHVCRMIAGRSNDTDIADELVDLADSLDAKLDRLREAIAALID